MQLLAAKYGPLNSKLEISEKILRVNLKAPVPSGMLNSLEKRKIDEDVHEYASISNKDIPDGIVNPWGQNWGCFDVEAVRRRGMTCTSYQNRERENERRCAYLYGAT